MTAYRYVRTGQLPAHRVHGQWRLRRRDVAAFGRRKPVARRGRGRSRRSVQVSRLRDRLVHGDESGAWQVVERMLTGGADPVEVYSRGLGPALRSIGDRWAAGEVTIAEEHRATAVASRLIGRMGPLFAVPGRRRGTIVLGAAPGDAHALPVAMVADVLRSQRYDVIDLGAATPVDSFLTTTSNTDAVRAVGISASTSEAVESAIDVIETLRASFPETPVLMGGPAVNEAIASRAGVGASAADAAAVVDVVDNLLS